MIGRADLLAVDVAAARRGAAAAGHRGGRRPGDERDAGRGLRRPGVGPDGRRPAPPAALDDGMELWVAEADGEMVGAGRLEPVRAPTSPGIWGGADPAGLARAGDLPRPHRRTGPFGARPRQDAACTATPPSSRGRSWNVPVSSRSPPRRRTAGSGVGLVGDLTGDVLGGAVEDSDPPSGSGTQRRSAHPDAGSPSSTDRPVLASRSSCASSTGSRAARAVQTRIAAPWLNATTVASSWCPEQIVSTAAS